MTKTEIKLNIGKFGEIKGIDSKGFNKTFSGKMVATDTADKVFCIDNDGVFYLFRNDKVMFEEREFVGLPEKWHGRDYTYLAGNYVFSDTKKDVNFGK